MSDPIPQVYIRAQKPEAWIDRSVTIFAGPEKGEKSEMEPNVVIGREMMGTSETFKGYLDRQAEAMEGAIPQLDILSRKDGEIKKKPAHNVLCRWMSPAGRVEQRLVFVSVGLGQIVTFAATAGVDDYKNNEDIFNAILASMDVSIEGDS